MFYIIITWRNHLHFEELSLLLLTVYIAIPQCVITMWHLLMINIFTSFLILKKKKKSAKLILTLEKNNYFVQSSFFLDGSIRTKLRILKIFFVCTIYTHYTTLKNIRILYIYIKP
jgi:hypothetical protein